jgi:hypothetical protein
MPSPRRPRVPAITLCFASLLVLGCAATKERIPTISPSVPTPEGAAAPVSHMGLWYVDLVEGRGGLLESGQCAYVHYTGWLAESGKQFETSRDSLRADGGPPFVFPLGAKQAIAGWELGLKGMRIGGRRRLIIPPALAYGAKGNPPVVPPRTALVFDIDLVGLATPTAKATPGKPPRCPAWG